MISSLVGGWFEGSQATAIPQPYEINDLLRHFTLDATLANRCAIAANMKESPLKDVLDSHHHIGRAKTPLFISATILEAVGTILLAFTISTILSRALTQEPVDYWYFLFLGLSLVVRFIADLLQNHFRLATGASCDIEIRQSVVNRLSQNRNAIDGEAFSTLFSRVIPSISDYYRDYLPVLRKAMVVPPVLLLAVFYTDLISGLILLVVAISTIVLLVLTGNLSRREKNKQWNELRSIRRHFIEIIAGGETIRQLGAVDRFRESIKARADRFRELTLGVLKMVFLSSFVLELMSSVSIAMVAVILGLRLIDGSFSYQKALMALILVPELFSYIRQLGAARHALMEAESAAPLARSFLFDTHPPELSTDDGQEPEDKETPKRSLKLGIVVILAALLTILAHFSQMALMMVSGVLLARCALQTPISSLHVLIAGVRFFGLARPVLRYGERLTTHYIALLFFKKVRLYIFDRLSGLDSRTLRHLHSGEILGAMDADTEKLDNIGPKIIWPLFAAVIAVILLPFIPPFSSISPRWLFISVLWLTISLPWIFYGQLPEPSGLTDIEKQSLDYARGLKDATVFDHDSKLAQRLIHAAEKENTKNTASQWRISLLRGLSLVFIYMIWGVALFNQGDLGGESLALVIFGMMSLTELFRSIPFIMGFTKESAAAYHRVMSFVSQPNTYAQKSPPGPPNSNDFLTIKNLTWTWPGNSEPLIKHLNLKLERGKLYGWVGPVGSGKSTLLDIVTGFQSVPEGKVYLQGYDVSQTKQSVLLENVCYVSQRSFVFKGSIRDNIQLANPTISDGEIEKLLNLVGLSPHQYDIEKDLGENAVLLSGGERQRLILARAMAQDKKIILLDEPFNNLDRNTQDRILQWMKREAERITLVMITHQAYGLEIMDEVISVFNGSDRH
ncbi:ATP-binding cassette domain-containing protein [bacterium]|nr:ATP-binding cassette domain-containing protein [bacterium]